MNNIDKELAKNILHLLNQLTNPLAENLAMLETVLESLEIIISGKPRIVQRFAYTIRHADSTSTSRFCWQECTIFQAEAQAGCRPINNSIWIDGFLVSIPINVEANAFDVITIN